MKTLAIITTTRADYGLLRPVIKRIALRAEVSYNLIATGSHISDNTTAEIEADGYIYTAIDIMKYPQDIQGVAKITALTQQLFIDYFTQNKPDGVLLLGDRYEVFAIAVSARMLDIPIFHISGGDVTNGAIDDCLRHCITKLSAVHFPSCERYARRLMALGEQPDSIHSVGGLGDENIRSLKFMDAKTLSDSLDFNLSRPFLLVTYHPETLSDLPEKQQVDRLLTALTRCNLPVVITGSNSDSGGDEINRILTEYCSKSPDSFYIKSMGVLRYLSAMRIAAAVIGNSSSGVCETPSFKAPTLNIGRRQSGRIMADNIVCCSCDEEDIFNGIATCLSAEFRKKCETVLSPYRGENTSDDIAKITARLLNKGISNYKEFYDAE